MTHQVSLFHLIVTVSHKINIGIDPPPRGPRLQATNIQSQPFADLVIADILEVLMMIKYDVIIFYTLCGRSGRLFCPRLLLLLPEITVEVSLLLVQLIYRFACRVQFYQSSIWIPMDRYSSIIIVRQNSVWINEFNMGGKLYDTNQWGRFWWTY